jgi:hypothetical protein
MNELIYVLSLNVFIISKHINYPNDVRGIYLVQMRKEEKWISADCLHIKFERKIIIGENCTYKNNRLRNKFGIKLVYFDGLQRMSNLARKLCKKSHFRI